VFFDDETGELLDAVYVHLHTVEMGGSALQNLYRELERAENVVGHS